MTTMESQNMHSSIPVSQNSDIISNSKLDVDQEQQQISTLNKTQQAPSKELIKNKLNMNSSLNAKADTNTSLNDQKKKDQSDLFDDEDILYNDEDENEIFREYNILHDRKLRAMDDIKNINERIKNNMIKIEESKKKLAELKEEKKKRQGDIMNLLSNKESIEEIYKNQIYLLNNSNYNNNTGANGNNNFNENTASLANDINNLNNLMNDNSAIHLNSNHNLTIIDNDISNNDEENFKITLKEIKDSEQEKYVEQVINMFEDIFKKKDENINESISDIINNSYELFVNNENNATIDNDENNNEISVTNFFSKMSLFIANQSMGKFSEMKINLLLRYLLKINYINTKLTRDIKFVNKKYKEQKRELNDLISSLEKKNLNLKEKNNRLENNIKEYDDNKLFFDKNNNEELSHEVVIEYEDGIDKNAEINYEDDVIDDNTIEKENEMMNKGLNPYNTNSNNNNNLKQTPVYRKIENQNNKQNKRIIVKDNDESEDKYLNEFLENKGDTRNKYNLKNKPELKKNSLNSNAINNNNENSIKKINNTNTNNIINLDKNKRLCPTPQHHIRKTEEELQNLTTIEKDHYNRVQRIMNSGPKYGIFGVNKYNPETSFNKEGSLFSPKKGITNVPKSSNKIDKTVRIESRQNHNFIGIINMTKVVPIKKKKRETGKKLKDKEDENEGGIKIINLEQDFINEEDKDDNDDKKINTSNSNSNSNINNNSTYDNNANKDIKSTRQNKNEVQGYYLNIINNVKKAKNENNNNNTNVNNTNNNNLNKKETNEKKENPEPSYKLNYKRSYKSTRIRELNLNNDNNSNNNNNINTSNSNNNQRNYLLNKMSNVRNELSLNTNVTNPTYNSTTSNNDTSKRSHSLSEHQSEEENGKKESIRKKYNTKKVIVMNSTNNDVSPNQTLRKKITSIPVSKVVGLGNKNFSANTYEKVNYKAGSKLHAINKNKK